MSEVKSDLDRAAREIRQRGISGWGNTCEEAAQRIRELESTNAKLREALMDLRSDLRELSEREGGLYAHFYARTCKALETPR